ncbi:uncharacterized protein LOC133263913 [Pezoporus flaviventris]|uniref:uncharacterized protein LOC133263913 n=1 Tax=Pezoporus flaviventris TaxID=889875 RepID=UPI002AB10A71|nr:uncharacterized protein LOC133263913 [Pezoporus flaviventris]
MEHRTLLLFVPLFLPCGAQGPVQCEEQAVPANGALELLPKKPLGEWSRVKWRTGVDAGSYQVILVAERSNGTTVCKSPFCGRAVFQEEPLSLRISPVLAADAGLYEAEFEQAGGGVSPRCFRVSVWGLCLCCAVELLKGLKGQSLSFPALHLLSHDIVRVTWRTKGTHIAEAKPRVRMFTTDFLPEFQDRLLIHPNSLSLQINPLQPSDSGSYEVVVDTLSDPTNPKTFRYSLLVLDGSPVPMPGTGDTKGSIRSTVDPHGPPVLGAGDTKGAIESTVDPHGALVPRTGVTKGPTGSRVDPHGASEPGAGDTGTQDTGGRHHPGSCGAQDRYCLLKGYLMAGVFVPLALLVAAVHIMTRDKGTKAGNGVLAGVEPPSITTPQGPSPWQRPAWIPDPGNSVPSASVSPFRAR